MKTPARLRPLLEDGLIDAVLYPLKSGKEADVYVVTSGDEVRCAKIYKDKEHRSFHKQVLYQEGRKAKNSRAARAMGKHSNYGKKVEEDEWQHHEVNTLFALHKADVRVPEPFICIDGVLLMELLLDGNGDVAQRLGDIEFEEDEARYCHGYLLTEAIKMLLEGVVHADLSEFNIVMTWEGPVIIDLPQAVDAAANNNAQEFFERDVRNLTHYFGRFAPELLEGSYGREIWQHFEAGTLTVDFEPTGVPEVDLTEVDVDAVVDEIEAARREAERRAERLAGEPTGPQREPEPYADREFDDEDDDKKDDRRSRKPKQRRNNAPRDERKVVPKGPKVAVAPPQPQWGRRKLFAVSRDSVIADTDRDVSSVRGSHE